MNKIKAVQESWIKKPAEVDLVTPHRIFVAEGAILKINKSKSRKSIYIYLFNDTLVITKPEKKGKVYCDQINMETASLNTTDEEGVLKLISMTETIKLAGETAEDHEKWNKFLSESLKSAKELLMNRVVFGTNVQDTGRKDFLEVQERENSEKKI